MKKRIWMMSCAVALLTAGCTGRQAVRGTLEQQEAEAMPTNVAQALEQATKVSMHSVMYDSVHDGDERGEEDNAAHHTQH